MKIARTGWMVVRFIAGNWYSVSDQVHETFDQAKEEIEKLELRPGNRRYEIRFVVS